MANNKPIQLSLFDMPVEAEKKVETKIESKGVFIIYKPEWNVIKKWLSVLNANYSKEEVYQIAKVFHPMLRRYDIQIQKTDGSVIDDSEIRPLFNMNASRENIARALAYMLGDKRNLERYVETLSDNMKDLWRYLLANIYCGVSRAKKILCTTDSLLSTGFVPTNGHVNWNRQALFFFEITPNFTSSRPKGFYREDSYYIYLNPYFQEVFFPIFFPKALAEQTLKELPITDDKLQCFDFEIESHRQYAAFASIISQKRPTSTFNAVSPTFIKSTAQKLAITEFDKKSNIRSKFFVEALTLVNIVTQGGVNSSSRYSVMLRSLISTICDGNNKYPYITQMMLPHLCAIPVPVLKDNEVSSVCTIMVNLLKQDPDNWHSLQELYQGNYSSSLGTPHQQLRTLVFPLSKLKGRTEIKNRFTGQMIEIDCYASEFCFTLFQSFAYLLASLGMVQLVVSPCKDGQSPFSGSKFVRLTPLGRFVFEIDKEYEVPEEKKIAYFELDPDRLIIRSLVNDNPYTQMILESAVAISKNRFEFTAESFLSNCYNKYDIEERISVIKDLVDSELPPLWNQFFQSLVSRCKPMETDRSIYIKYRVNPENTQLLHLLSSDSKLRDMSIRAEGYMLLVKEDNLMDFKCELKKHGYLL